MSSNNYMFQPDKL